MSWLFKDPINSGLAQFEHAQWNSNKYIKYQIIANKIKLPQINFFQLLQLIQSYEDVPFSVPKWPICPEQNFLVQTIVITFIYLLTLFIVQNFKKILQHDDAWRYRVMTMRYFSVKNRPFARNKFFLGNYYHSHLPISPFHCAKF